jgi:hypothetical protein
MSYDMLTREEKKWVEKHITGPIFRGVSGVPKIEGCKRGSGYKLFEAYGEKALGCMDQALSAYFPDDNQPVKICRYNVKSEAGGWYIEYHESTDIISLKSQFPDSKPLRVLEAATGAKFKNSYEFFVSDIRHTGFVGGEFAYAPPGLYIETYDVPDPDDDGNPSVRRRTKHIRAYIVHPDFNIEKIIDKKNWYFIQLYNRYEAEREGRVRSRIGIGDPWASKPEVSEKFCKDCLRLREDLYYRLGGKPFRCPAERQPWRLECEKVKHYLGEKKR